MIRFLLALLLLALPAAAQSPPSRQIVSASHPLAAGAALGMLRAGGNALDAAITAQAVLTLVEPQSSGIGGGALLLYWDARKRELVAWDGRETAPAAAPPGLFLRDGHPMPFREAMAGGRAVGVPGVMRMLEAAHREHGTLPWLELFAPAAMLAENGFPVSAQLAGQIAANAAQLRQDPALRAYFFLPDGQPVPEGHALRNPALAATLQALAEQGADALHRGPIAAELAALVRGHANPGLMTTDDLAGYAPRRREALCAPYRAYRVCGFPAPSSGGTAVLQMLGMLAHQRLAGLDPRGADAAHLLGEAGRLAFADRNRYLADTDHVPVPLRGLLDLSYLAIRAQLIDRDRALPVVRPGNPLWDGATGPATAAQPPQPENGTAHLSIADADGNVLAMTTTIEATFGARVMLRGFLLNNQLTDFSLVPEVDGRPVANRVAGAKRPRSSMAPSIVFDAEGRPVIALGSAGGARIIGHVAQALVALLDWGLDPQAATSLPHAQAVDGVVELEEGTTAAGLEPVLRARGMPLAVRPNTSGLQIIRRGPQGWQGGADPRREGIALGD